MKLTFLWWQSWHLRNDIVFDTGKSGIGSSVLFLQNYLQSLQNLNERETGDTAQPQLAWARATQSFYCSDHVGKTRAWVD